MHTVNIHEAKTQLSKLVDQAAKGEPFIIAKAGKPLVSQSSPKMTALSSMVRAAISSPWLAASGALRKSNS